MDHPALARFEGRRLLLLILALSVAIFVGDAFVPSGFAYSVLYVFVVLATLWSPQQRVTWLVTSLATALTVLGVFLGPSSTPLPVVAANRAFAICALWVTALVVWQRTCADRSLRNEIAARKQMECELRENHRVMQSLAGRLLNSHENERRRLARHLHDDLSQRLAVWTMELELAEQEPPENFRHRLQGFRRRTEQLAADVREISHRLHPAILGQLGLVEAVQRECVRFNELEGFEVHFSSSSVPANIPEQVSLSLYRIVQEALRNTAKHAQAKHSHVRLHGVAEKLWLAVEDDGIGFAADNNHKQSHLGLLSIEERVRLLEGQLVVASRPGRGTRIEVIVPLPTNLAHSADSNSPKCG